MASVVLVVGLGFGDEGKGSTIDGISRESSGPVTIVRVGGPQAAHNVVLSDGRHHTFAQFGSGTLVSGCRTHLSRHMLVNPVTLESEERHLWGIGVTDAFDRMTIEDEALVTTPFQMAANRIKEMVRDRTRHGSCGMGIGETVVDALAMGRDALRAGDLRDRATIERKLAMSQERKRAELRDMVLGASDRPEVAKEWDLLNDPDVIPYLVSKFERLASRVRIVDAGWLQGILRERGTVVIENSQGVLLDEFVGFLPYATRRVTTFAPGLDLLPWFDGPVTRLGVIRTYMTRHGAGPMVTEDPDLRIPEEHNCWGPWQQDFRCGHLDFVMLRYAVAATGGVDQIAVTHMDRREPPHKVCICYANCGNGSTPVWRLPLPTTVPEQFALTRTLAGAEAIYETLPTNDMLIARIEAETGARVVSLSNGLTAADRSARIRSAA